MIKGLGWYILKNDKEKFPVRVYEIGGRNKSIKYIEYGVPNWTHHSISLRIFEEEYEWYQGSVSDFGGETREGIFNGTVSNLIHNSCNLEWEISKNKELKIENKQLKKKLNKIRKLWEA